MRTVVAERRKVQLDSQRMGRVPGDDDARHVCCERTAARIGRGPTKYALLHGLALI